MSKIVFLIPEIGTILKSELHSLIIEQFKIISLIAINTMKFFR